MLSKTTPDPTAVRRGEESSGTLFSRRARIRAVGGAPPRIAGYPWGAQAPEREGRAASFLALCNSLEHELRRVVHATTYLRFYELVDAACERLPSLDPERAFLRVAGDLRNSIVHWKAYPNEVPAAPSPFLVERLEAVLAFLRKPPRVLPRFRRRLRVF